jgi:hypothetical protein
MSKEILLCNGYRLMSVFKSSWRRLTPRAADGYAASQQAQLFTVGEQPAKVSGKSRRR